MLEDFEDDLPFLFGGFLRTCQFTLFFTFDLELEVLMEVILQIVLEFHVLRKILDSILEFLASCFLCHLETYLLEVMFDRSFDEFMLLSDFVHEVLEDFMG
jgi:hypothetical protein